MSSNIPDEGFQTHLSTGAISQKIHKSNEATGNVPSPNLQESNGNITNNDEVSVAQKDKFQFYETSEDLQYLCRDNGISANQFVKKSHNISKLEIFLGFWPSMKTVENFIGLRELSIVKHPTISKIEGIQSCPNLEILCIMECSVEKIENLYNCKHLKRINFSSNKIRKIQGLEALEKLEILWLNDNYIEKLEGLWTLKSLKQFWVCRNQIQRVDSALNCNFDLVELNLADNQISSFKSLISLSNLEHLTNLTLSDPHYGDNPVCRLCNYQTYFMCQLSRLVWFDTIELSTQNKQIAEATMIKKKMYYNMRMKSIKRDVFQRIKKSNEIRMESSCNIEVNLSALIRHKKEIQRQLSELDGDEDTLQTQNLKRRLENVEKLLKDRYTTLNRMNSDFEVLREKLLSTADINITRLLLELETGGNIRLEDGKPLDAWYISCVDLVRSRLFSDELLTFGIRDIKVNRVTRINNRFLRNRFEARIEELQYIPDEEIKENVSKKGVTVREKPEVNNENVDEETQSLPPMRSSPTSFVPGSKFETNIEYLFYLQPALLDQVKNHDAEQFFASEYGFREPHQYQALGLDAAIKLSNSVSFLDLPRIAANLQNKGLNQNQQELSPSDLKRYSCQPYRHELTKEQKAALQAIRNGGSELPGAILLVVKVFPGFTTTKEQSELKYPIDIKHHEGLQSIQVPRSSDNKQKLYYMFDNALILPEYIVEYQYVLADASTKSLLESTDYTHQTRGSNSLDGEGFVLGAAAKLADSFDHKYRLRKSPLSPSSYGTVSRNVNTPNGDMLDEDIHRLLQSESAGGDKAPPLSLSTFKVLSATVDLIRIKHLNFLGCELEAVPYDIRRFENLEVLVLSYNKLKRLDNMDGLIKLKSLDVGYNQIRNLDHLVGLDNLSQLELNNNQIESFEDLKHIGISLSSLKHLDLRNNPLCFTKRYRCHVLQYIKTLDSLDQQSVSREEYMSASRIVTKLTASKIWDHVRRSRHFASANDALHNELVSSSIGHLSNQSKPEQDDDDTDDHAKRSWNAVEELSMNRELIYSIEGLEIFPNLRFASFCDNIIKIIEGFDKCTRLEELYLEDNQIEKIESLDTLVFLKKLNLGKNRLSTIENLDVLENLTQLSLEDNEITSLRGLASAKKLMELYIGNNKIENLKEIQHLKSLPKLTILDMTGNEVTRMPEYRLYVVYYLRRVKVLDGVSVSSQDQSDAKQKYSGKLSMEFLVEKCGGVPLDRIQELDLSSCRIRDIGLFITGKIFFNLRELNLENNHITDINGLESLPKLRTLNLNRNRIERLIVSSSSNSTHTSVQGSGVATIINDGKGIFACTQLETLLLAYNQIMDMNGLGLVYLEALRVLNLEGNAISCVNGLENNKELREIRLDKNKIRQLDSNSTSALTQLRALSLEDNGMKFLVNFNNLLKLEILDLSNNRINDIEEVERLGSIPGVNDLRLTSNPITKKHLYRQTVIHKLGMLRYLDGREIGQDERDRVYILFAHEKLMIQDSNSRQCSTQLSLAPSTIVNKQTLAKSSVPSVSTIETGLPSSQLQKVIPSGSQGAYNGEGNIAIANSNTTTRSLLPGHITRSHSLNVAHQYFNIGLSVAAAAAAVANAGVLTSTGGEQFNLAALRNDRRGSIVQFDTSSSSSQNDHPEVTRVSPGVQHTMSRGPAMVTNAGTLLGGGDLPKGQINSSSKVSSEPRIFSGYVVSHASQKRFPSIHDPERRQGSGHRKG